MPVTDATFYPNPYAAIAAAPEQFAYVAAFDPNKRTASFRMERLLERALPHEHGHHAALARRYLLVPGSRSSTIYVLDTKPDPPNPMVAYTIEASDLAAKAGSVVKGVSLKFMR
jgi:methanethiol oxidase